MAQEKKETKGKKRGTSSSRANQNSSKKKVVQKKETLTPKTTKNKGAEKPKTSVKEKASPSSLSKSSSAKTRAQERARKKSQQANSKAKSEKKTKKEIEEKAKKSQVGQKRERTQKRKKKEKENKSIYISPKQFQKKEKVEKRYARPHHRVFLALLLLFVLIIGIDAIRGLSQNGTLSHTNSGHDILNDILLDRSDIVMVGSSDFKYSKVNSPLKKKQEAKIIRMDSKGTTLFEKAYETESNSSFASVSLLSDGYLAVGSQTTEGTGTSKAILVKYDKEGNVVWDRSYASHGNAEFLEAIPVADGIWVVGSGSKSEKDSSEQYGLVTKYDLSGQLVFEKLYEENPSVYRGGVVVGTYLYVVGRQKEDMGILSCYAQDGTYQWTKEYEHTDSFGFTDVVFFENSLYVVGAKKILPNNDENESRETENTDALLLRYSLEGNVLFEKVFGGSGFERYQSVITYGQKLMAVGFSSSKDSGLKIFTDGKKRTGILVKFDSNGNIEGKTVFGGSNNDYLTSITTDNSNLYITASTNSKDGNIMTTLDNGRDSFGRLVKIDSRLRILFLR